MAGTQVTWVPAIPWVLAVHPVAPFTSAAVQYPHTFSSRARSQPVSRLLALCLTLAVAAGASAADTGLPPAILDLHKSGKLFERSEFKTVRAAAAQVFQARQADTIQEVWGPDHAALSA